MKTKKYLSFTSLRQMVSDQILTWPDSRRQNSTDHSLHDTVMSALACMYFQDPSLLQFQKEMEQMYHQNNLRTLFGVQTIPSSNTMKDILDNQESRRFHPTFKNIVQRLRRGKQLSQFNLLDNLTVCSIDATQYHSSESVRCQQCLTKHKENQDKPTVYQHSALQAALMHPDMKQVIPIMAEPIKNGDGTIKQDCETNAAKRLIPLLRQQFPKMGLIVVGDDLFSRQPMIETVLANNLHFFFVAKPTSHKHMMKWIDTNESLIEEVKEVDEKGRTIVAHQWINNVPLRSGEDAIKVNYFRKTVIAYDHTGKQKYRRTSSWITDLDVTTDNIVLFTRGAKCRWKIENECFNTLKNQGYHLTHNYGHGEKHLAFNFYLLTLLAFTLHQIAELCDIAFKACRQMAGSKRSLWEKFRTIINIAVFENLEQFFNYFLDREAYNFTNGYAVKRPPP